MNFYEPQHVSNGIMLVLFLDNSFLIKLNPQMIDSLLAIKIFLVFEINLRLNQDHQVLKFHSSKDHSFFLKILSKSLFLSTNFNIFIF